jgi:hypothetical protein
VHLLNISREEFLPKMTSKYMKVVNKNYNYSAKYNFYVVDDNSRLYNDDYYSQFHVYLFEEKKFKPNPIMVVVRNLPMSTKNEDVHENNGHLWEGNHSVVVEHSVNPARKMMYVFCVDLRHADTIVA